MKPIPQTRTYLGLFIGHDELRALWTLALAINDSVLHDRRIILRRRNAAVPQYVADLIQPSVYSASWGQP